MKKSLRFEIFRRDGFTCRYCGSRPPEVVLEVDHVVPRAAGGSDDPLNLVAACMSCNRGKGVHRLDLGSPAQPDADLEYLSVQQELAEIERYERSLAAREAARVRLSEALFALWMELSGLDWGPSAAVLASLLSRYEPEVVECAIRDVAPKIATGYIPARGDQWIRYLNVVARNIAADDPATDESGAP